MYWNDGVSTAGSNKCCSTCYAVSVLYFLIDFNFGRKKTSKKVGLDRAALLLMAYVVWITIL